MRARLLLFLFFFIVLPWVNGCGEIGPGTVEKSSGRTARVEVAVVKSTTHPEIYEAMGTVLAQTTSILSSKLMGTVRSILVEEGQPVKAAQYRGRSHYLNFQSHHLFVIVCACHANPE